MNSVDTLQAHFKNEREKFLNILDSIIILDIGTIEYVSPEGRATAVSSSFIDSKPITYADAEVIYPGNNYGCHQAACPGMACLIFLPKSCMPNVSDLKLRVGATSYNRDGVKVMPIGNGSNNNVSTVFSEGGNLSILGQEYSIVYGADSVTFQREDGTTALTIDGTGQMYVSRQTNTGTLNINIEDTGVTKTWLSQNRDVLWTDTLNPDGSRSFIQSNPNDSEADPLFSMTIGADGTLTVNTASNINVSTTGDASVTADGNVSVDANQINLNGDSKSLVTYGELDNALSTFLQQLTTSLSTTLIAGNGSPQTWTDFPTSIDISSAEASTLKTGSSS
ncbi:MAG: hypothetical protein J6Q48_02315 [Bacteroidaceae bacterium]|nr:hypothetical protein [Bacteroidaceae bacterium]